MSKGNVAEQTPQSRGLENEGEGNKTAARRYNDATQQFIEDGKVDEAAAKAKDAVSGTEGEELRRAEQEGKRSQTGPAKGQS